MLDTAFFYEDAFAASDPGNTTVPLPTTTAPEQLHLTWGADPTKEVTVSWAAPGTVQMPAPTFVYSTSPITADNPGRSVSLPAPTALQPMSTRTAPTVTSFTDGRSKQTTYHYHVPLSGLDPATTYYYQVSDGAPTPSTAGASFTTAPAGRAAFRFSSYGDIGTPPAGATGNVSGYSWNSEGSNYTCIYEVDAIENPSDGGPQPLFHLINGDLCYANNDSYNTPSVWRDYGVNVSRSAQNRPWMPTLGNHEMEVGTTAQSGLGSGTYNGAYGNGNYQARFLLPDNGVLNYDGNHLQGQFYSFQVGTVFFVALDADDIALQNYQYGYTGTLVSETANNSLVPGGAQANRQTMWLEETLANAREDSSVEMIVVWMHQCALSSSSTGNGADMGIRQTWGPLFDQYQVDLVLSGHEHNYERSYPVRGYDPPSGVATAAFTSNGVSYTSGQTCDTRRPTVVATTPTAIDGASTWDTSQGTVYLVLGGGGAQATNSYGEDSATGLPRANVWVTLGGRDATEDATWSAARDTSDAHGYAYFDVDPGSEPGQTTITFQWFQLPTVGADGVTLPTTPYEKFVFGRNILAGGAPSSALPEFAAPAIAIGATTVAVAGAATVVRKLRHQQAAAQG